METKNTVIFQKLTKWEFKISFLPERIEFCTCVGVAVPGLVSLVE